MRNNFTVQVNKATIHYNDEGQSDLPLVCIHGFPFDRSSWLPQYDFFKSRRRVVIYDIRGFGDSLTDSDTVPSMDVYAKDFLAFLTALKIEKALVCGLSMGGYILMNALKMAPEKFAAIILCDTQCTADTAEGKQKRSKTIEQVQANGVSEFAKNFVKSVFHEKTVAAKKEVVKSLEDVISRTAEQSIVAAIKALADRPDTCTVLESVTVPTLVICGAQDTLTPPEKSQAMHTLVKHSVYNILDGAGHVSNLDQPEAFNRLVEEFISGL